MNNILKEDSSHKKIFLFDYSKEVYYDGRIWYSTINDYNMHYLSFYNIDIKPREYVDTIQDYDGNLIDRYFVDFYHNGKKIECVKRKQVCWQDGEFRSSMYETDSCITYYKKDGSGKTIEEWNIAEHRCDDVYSLGIKYNGNEKEVSITSDETGNIIVYLNEKKKDIFHYPARYRKGGDKYYIPIGSERHTASEYIDALVKSINHKINSPEMIELFELMIRDPRFEAVLNRLLVDTKDKTTNSYFDKMREQIEKEYQEKMAALNYQMDQLTLISNLSKQYNGLVPGKDVYSQKRR